MNKNNLKKYYKIYLVTIYILIILNIFSNVYGLGIAPSKKIIEYTNQEINISLRIINGENRNITLKISSGGDLSQYVKINGGEELINIPENTGEKIIFYTLKLPQGIDPQKNTLSITVTEVNTNSESTVGGLLSLTHQLSVNIPYNEKYIYSELNITSKENSGTSILTITNKGTKTINEITGKFEVIDSDKRIIYIKSVSEINDLEPQEINTINTYFNINTAGEYTGRYTLNYDDKTYVSEKKFEIGNYNLIIENIDINNFRLGTIAKFNIGVTNYWNEQIEDIYTETIITDQVNKVVGKYSSDKTSLNPDKDYLTTYWDTNSIIPGLYNMKITIYAKDTNFTKEYLIDVKPDTIKIENNSNKNNIMMILGITLIISAISLFILVLRYNNKKLYK